MNKFISQTRILGALAFLVACVALIGAGTAPYAQAQLSKVNDPASGNAVMVAGEFWDSYMPPNQMTNGPYYSEATADIVKQIRVGNFDRAWSTPTHMWPGGWNFGAFWNKGVEISVWDPDTTFNPPTIGGVTNPSYVATAGKTYAYAAYPNTKRGKTVPGVGVASRDYKKETAWAPNDAGKRHHVIYEAAWPTNVGVDVKMRIYQYTLNWNNFNDFTITEFTFTNTGVVDMNLDGTAEKTNHVIEGIAMTMHGEYMASYSLSEAAGRGNAFFAQRAIGYIGDNDASGSPWAMHIAFPGESGSGTKDMGIFAGPQRYAADVWSAWAFLGAKGATGTDFPTRFGTHAVGVGPQRGWYISDGVGKGFNIGTGDPRTNFIGATGQFYVDGGKSLDGSKFNLAPNPNVFASGTAGDIRTFVLKTSGITAPNGDLKSTNTFGVNPYEPGWTKGFTAANNFDGDGFQGIGPFKLEVNQSVTIALAVAGGFRLQGVANAIGTARWVYANKTNADYDLPASVDYPAVPDIRVDNTLTQSVRVRWDNKAEASPDFAGYKVYKTSLTQQVDWLATGTRGLDEYWRNMTPGPTPASLLKPINPNFTAQSFVAGRNGVPDTWGPYTLMAVIPKAQLSTYADASATGYNYSWEDKVVDVGFKYWYYVAAYTNKSLTLSNYTSFSNNATTDFVETSNVNRNGASGLWVDTYPFATLNTFFPKTTAAIKAIGTGFIVKSALANPADLVSGKAKITVKPNPYKKKALFDNATLSYDHKIQFMNLPPYAKVTIIDVSGQIVDEFEFRSSDPNNGSTFWDMFSKDGLEVASGLYIYVAEYEGGKQVGYFSILR